MIYKKFKDLDSAFQLGLCVFPVSTRTTLALMKNPLPAWFLMLWIRASIIMILPGDTIMGTRRLSWAGS